MTTKEYQAKRPLTIFLSYFKRHRKLFALDISCALVISLIDLAFPLVTRSALYEMLPNRMYRTFFIVMAIAGGTELYCMLLRPYLRHPGGSGHPGGPVPAYAGDELRFL